MTLCIAAIAPGDQSIVTASNLMLSDDRSSAETQMIKAAS